MNLFKKVKASISIAVENVDEKSLTLVTKKISGKGSYRVYINGWVYNVVGYPIKEETKHEIPSNYFKKGENLVKVVILDNKGNKHQAYEEGFKVA